MLLLPAVELYLVLGEHRSVAFTIGGGRLGGAESFARIIYLL